METSSRSQTVQAREQGRSAEVELPSAGCGGQGRGTRTTSWPRARRRPPALRLICAGGSLSPDSPFHALFRRYSDELLPFYTHVYLQMNNLSKSAGISSAGRPAQFPGSERMPELARRFANEVAVEGDWCC